VIHGVNVKQLKVIPDQRGRLMEILRRDDPLFLEFGQVYITTAYPGVVKAWHYHKLQTDHLTTLTGMVQIALYDSREDSPTHGQVNVFYTGTHNPVLVQVPPLVYHGFKNVGLEEALILNVPTLPYRYDQPDEFRLDPHHNDIPHDWNRRDG
jgi:dTDP-4-dehydrorhamnose 3,5-epimerase